MPQLTIGISEQAEAKIVDCMKRQQNFKIEYVDNPEGGWLGFGEMIPVKLKEISFKFEKPDPPPENEPCHNTFLSRLKKRWKTSRTKSTN